MLAYIAILNMILEFLQTCYLLNVTWEFLLKYLLALDDSHENLFDLVVGCLLHIHIRFLLFLLCVNVPLGNLLKLIWECLTLLPSWCFLKLRAGGHVKRACGWRGLCSVSLCPLRHDFDPLFRVRTQVPIQTLGPPVRLGHVSMLNLGTKYMSFTKSL